MKHGSLLFMDPAPWWELAEKFGYMLSGLLERTGAEGKWTLEIVGRALIAVNTEDPANSWFWMDEESGWQPWDAEQQEPAL